MQTIHRRSDGSINMDYYRARPLRERSEYLDNLSTSASHALPSLTPAARRRVKLFIAAFAVATGAFWATMLTRPPTTVAAQPLSSINVNDLVTQKDLPMVEPADPF